MHKKCAGSVQQVVDYNQCMGNFNNQKAILVQFVSYCSLHLTF
ncbi:hypothetical protein ALT785_690033 [Alteromonas infernus]